ncbi:MAG: hypothetical protein BA865_03390 [Desulfobacterales bacterium S5133MH4]|nr:MAG: hypothetical protein BA865_03390 [Desulfobacterales bacterium S5133MH4]
MIWLRYRYVSSSYDRGKKSQFLDWKHKQVLGGFLNDAIMKAETGCSLSKINNNNVRRNRLQIWRIIRFRMQ